MTEPLVSSNEFRCAPWTQAQGVDPIGSAPRFDTLLLVEWPLPWPNDISEVEALSAAARDPRATVMAVVPRDPDAELVRVVHHRRAGSHRFHGVDHLVPATEVPDLLARLLDDPDPDGLPSAVSPAPVDVLVCAHGRRDPCCGKWGTLLHLELEARVDDARVWRCSHTGGHRFAPTAITVHDGRAWAFADADLLVGVLERSIPVSSLHGHDRGNGGLELWAQAVERALFERIGWAWADGLLLEVDTDVADDRRSARVTIVWTGAGDDDRHEATGDVVVVRDVPVLVCGEPPEAAKKSSYEVAVTRLVIDGEDVPLS